MVRMLPVIAVGIVLIAGWGVYFAVRTARHARREMLDAVRNLGFLPAEPTPALIQRLTNVYANTVPGGNPTYHVRNLFSKRLIDGDMYVFDLFDTSKNDNRHAEKLAVAVVSPRLSLPPFVMLPRVGGKGALAPMANKMLTWVASRYGAPVDVAHSPEFAQRYLISSHEPDAARRFLVAARLRRMAEIPNASMHAGGDMFSLSHFETTREAPQQRLRERVEHASHILSVFTAS